MDKKRPQNLHFGGPLGLAGLALLAGATGIAVFSGEPESDETVLPVSKVEAAASNEVVESTTETAVDKDKPVTSSEADKVSVEPSIRPAQEKTVSEKPASQRGTEVTYIVRIKGASKLDEAARLYRRDYPGAQKAFQAYQSNTPELKGFRLVGSSYSGEVKLAYDLAPGTEPTRDVVQGVQDRLTTIDGFAYADPDYIAHPGKGD